MDWARSVLNDKRDPWNDKIHALRQMLKSVGSMWPDSTKLSGYAEKGPYHCGMCRYLEGQDRCSQAVVNADEQVKKHLDGMAKVDAKNGCCEFVEPK